MRVYTLLSRLPWAHSYTAKVLVLTFVGVHVPLVTLVVGVLIVARASPSEWLTSMSWTLGGTVLAAGLTMGMLYSLLWPVRAAARALDEFVASGRLPELPGGYTDEAGAVMSGVQRTLTELKQRMDQLAHEATTDALTGLHNRRWIDSRLVEEWERGQETGAALSLMMLDIDRFKQINDTHGHSTGDAVLRDLSQLLRTSLRRWDIRARWGGEEFVILMPGMTGEQAKVAAERLLTIVRGRSLGGLPVGGVTLSAGVGSAADADSVDDMLEQADTHLYEAKHAGRDRVR